MPWNPDVYNKFKDVRYLPFYDLVDLMYDAGHMKCIDLGCGTGEQTQLLAEKFKSASFLGIDSSKEMLEKSQLFKSDRLGFQQATTEQIIDSGQQWDVIFANASLQWSEDHEKLFPALLSLLNENGQMAVQMPVQHENLLNKLLYQMVQEEPFCTYLKGWKRKSPLLSIDHYAQILFDAGMKDIQIIQKVYPIIADDAATLFDFISGSALVPYMERLSADQREIFTNEYMNRIKKSFQKFPAMYAFKRLLIYGKKG